MEEVIRCREQVESLERRLKAAESRRKETQEVGKDRCADCGRVCSPGEGKATTTGGSCLMGIQRSLNLSFQKLKLVIITMKVRDSWD